MGTPWVDGAEYVTQCSMRPGGSYTYRFTIENQEGTLWWHAHSKWMRATIYGALIINPKQGSSCPYPKPAREYPVLPGEWWNRDPMDVLKLAEHMSTRCINLKEKADTRDVQYSN
ncbi:hypothetical protein Nepgr_010847 [Nepenthes gracilis]|uniref:Plastocyanin-like domain-containing protein n=1 Tax=Nepenthes gracilis TaxID=150966 RepID=A0AAD3SDC6_NEPGR|nr:hypothetical protein Nepgr_010847 [Nepenthes gracilis]